MAIEQSTTTVALTNERAGNQASPNRLPDFCRVVKLGTILTPQKSTVSQAAATTIALSPAAYIVQSVRVTGGAAAAGERQISDSGGTPSATVATLSDDGATLTFEANVTDAVVVYMPRSAVDMAALFES